MEKVNISLAAEGLSAYAAQRLAGFEQHRLGDAYRQPETRHEWIRDILRGMAEVCGQDAAPLLQSFEQRLTDVHGASAVAVLSPGDQKRMIRSLDRYVSALGRMEGEQRSRIFHARELLDEVCAYLPWDPDANGARSTRDRAWEQLQRAVARRPIRFTRVLLGGELDPGGVEFLPGMVNDEKSVRRTQEFQRLTVEYPKREEWPALCVVCMGGGRRENAGTIDADGLDMAVIREAGEAFIKRTEVRPVWSHQLAVPVYEQIRVLKVEPGKAPEEVTMPNALEALQAAVGGDIEAVGLDSDAYLVCNELGKVIGLPANRRVNGDIIAGTFLIVGSTDVDFCSLSDEDAAYYDRELSEPMPSYGESDQPTQWEFRVL